MLSEVPKSFSRSPDIGVVAIFSPDVWVLDIYKAAHDMRRFIILKAY